MMENMGILAAVRRHACGHAFGLCYTVVCEPPVCSRHVQRPEVTPLTHTHMHTPLLPLPLQVEDLDFSLRSKDEASSLAKLEKAKSALDAVLAFVL